MAVSKFTRRMQLPCPRSQASLRRRYSIRYYGITLIKKREIKLLKAGAKFYKAYVTICRCCFQLLFLFSSIFYKVCMSIVTLSWFFFFLNRSIRISCLSWWDNFKDRPYAFMNMAISFVLANVVWENIGMFCIRNVWLIFTKLSNRKRLKRDENILSRKKS